MSMIYKSFIGSLFGLGRIKVPPFIPIVFDNNKHLLSNKCLHWLVDKMIQAATLVWANDRNIT